MSDPVADRYEAYYADKLWGLLPAVYRAADSRTLDAKGPLREMVERIGAQAATLRRSIDRLWEDQSIESCDDWVVAYIGDLLATKLVDSLDARGQRIDVAKTIYYRRRKGTAPLLEELAANITGWDARVVEFFRRLGRNRHGLDPAFGWPLEVFEPDGITPTLLAVEGLIGTRTRTLMGGYADLRNVYGAELTDTAFDEFFHTADVRIGRGRTGWYNIPHLGVFLWRVESVPVDGVTPVVFASCPNEITFDPTGRDLQLFAASNRVYDDGWVSPEEKDLPTPIRQGLLQSALVDLYAGTNATGAYDPRSLRLYSNGYALPENVIPVSQVTADPRASSGMYYVDSVRGRAYLPSGVDATKILVGYHYGFPSTIGAGGYDRRLPGQASAFATGGATLSGGGAFASAPSYGSLVITDSLTYSGVPTPLPVTPAMSLTLAAANETRPLIRPTTVGTQWVFVGSVDANGIASELVLDGLFLSGCDVVFEGRFEKITLRTCTLDPGRAATDAGGHLVPALAADNRALAPAHVTIAGRVQSLVVDRCILGPLSMDPDPTKASVETVTIQDSIVQAVLAEKAIDLRTGMANVLRTTVLGTSQFHQLEASDVIFDDVAIVDDAQDGCTRFTAYATGSKLPRRYECVEIAAAQQLFVSRDFGNFAYAQLLESVDASISEGADDGSEMGAYCRENVPIKERSLLIKYQEYMPVGLTPVLIYVT